MYKYYILFLLVFFTTQSIWSQEKLLGTVHKIEGDAMGMAPNPFGGVLFDKNNPNKVYLATNANYRDGKIMYGDVIRDSNKKIIGFKNWTTYRDAPHIDSQFAFLPNNGIIYTNFVVGSSEISTTGKTMQLGPNGNISYIELTKGKSVGGGIIKNPPWHPKPNNYTDYSWTWYPRISDVRLGAFNNNAYSLEATLLAKSKITFPKEHLIGNNLTDIEGIVYVKGDAIPEIKNDPQRNGRDVIIVGSFTIGYIKYGFINADGTIEDPTRFKHIFLKSNPSEKKLVPYLNGMTIDPVSGHLVGSIWYSKAQITPLSNTYLWTMDIGIQTACNQNVNVSA
ncbi:MAG: hypothetical protein OIF50_15380, partial [Flavobacteriaceae bacterium]|nr:hypothetical protein [Flavobacteriaceae bacterium]